MTIDQLLRDIALRTTQAELSELTLAVESLEAQVDTLSLALGRGEYDISSTKVVSLSSNPAAEDLAIRTETLDRLKEENRILLERLQNQEENPRGTLHTSSISTPQKKSHFPSEETDDSVPRATFVNLQAEKDELLLKIEQAEKSRSRLKEIFARTAQELRDACRSLFGYRLEPLENGRIKLTTVFGGSEYFLIFGPGTTGSSKFQLVGGNENFVTSQRVQTGLNFWMAERNCVPGFLASLTLELFEESTRGRTTGWTEGD